MRLFPKRHVRKTLASILSEKATTVIKRIRECITHSTTHEAKKKKSGKSVEVSWHFTGYLKPVIRGSNMVGLPQHFDVLSWFEDWLSKASDWRDIFQFGSRQFQNIAVLVDGLLDSQTVSV